MGQRNRRVNIVEREIDAIKSILELTNTCGDVITLENTHWAFADLMGWDSLEKIQENREKRELKRIERRLKNLV